MDRLYLYNRNMVRSKVRLVEIISSMAGDSITTLCYNAYLPSFSTPKPIAVALDIKSRLDGPIRQSGKTVGER